MSNKAPSWQPQLKEAFLSPNEQEKADKEKYSESWQIGGVLL